MSKTPKSNTKKTLSGDKSMKTLFNYFIKTPGINSSPTSFLTASAPSFKTNSFIPKNNELGNPVSSSRKLKFNDNDNESEISKLMKNCKRNMDEKKLNIIEEKKKMDCEEKDNVLIKSKDKNKKEYPTKRRRIIVEDEEESLDESFNPSEEDDSSDDEELEEGGSVEEESPFVNKKRKRQKDNKDVDKYLKTKIKNSIVKYDKTKESKYATKTKLSSLDAGNSSPSTSLLCKRSFQLTSSSSTSSFKYFHETLDFLKTENLKDLHKRSLSNPDYNPRTLYVPPDFLNKQTPGMRQWWILKSTHFDTLLFFKLGKFYELFHMDAMIGVENLGILFMKGDHAHCGFPEISFSRFCDVLVQKGFKVARVEQTETPEMMNERCRQAGKVTKWDRVVRREICSVQTKGTKRSSFIDGDCFLDYSNFLLAISELTTDQTTTYGICFVDVMIGTFHISQFEDDRHGSILRTLVSHYPPVQVLYEKNKISEKTNLILTSILGNCQKEALKSEVEFWTAHKTLEVIKKEKYFVNAEKEEKEKNKKKEFEEDEEWPEIFRDYLLDRDKSSPSSLFLQAFSSLGAIIFYLSHCLIDKELLSMKSFKLYNPPNNNKQLFYSANNKKPKSAVKYMVLDGVTLHNLDVLVNGSNGKLEGSLLHKIDFTKTPFGKRLLKQWLCSPLFIPSLINQRLDAIEELINNNNNNNNYFIKLNSILNKLPDLERLLNKIHTLGSKKRNSDHPDSRAVFFEALTYSKKKIEDFLATLESLRNCEILVEWMDSETRIDTIERKGLRSSLLKKCMKKSEWNKEGLFPNLSPILSFFDEAFDHQKARTEGVIKPKKGVNKKYDESLRELERVKCDLNNLLSKLKKKLNCSSLIYFGTGKNRFQLEVPEELSRKIGNDFDLTSQRKGFKRYQSQEIRSLFSELMEAEEKRDSSLRDTMRCIFDQFDQHYKFWSQAISCIATLDVLVSMSVYSSQSNGCMSRPQFVEHKDDVEPFIEIINGRHPCLEGGDFIPNHTFLGTIDQERERQARSLLLTGPNMGGKSTLMRQVGLISILSQLGCYVPCDNCRLTPLDRIFTRLGASDHIMKGESTFYVELSETSSILHHATNKSLVLLDELGRGTATFDGTAIATSVLEELTNHICSLTLFSTHYHSIVDLFKNDPKVSLVHMACMVENGDEEDPTQETITFLFKIVPGNCPKSYGFNAAKLAGVPDDVIRDAYWKSRDFENSVQLIEKFRLLWDLNEKQSSLIPSILN